MGPGGLQKRSEPLETPRTIDSIRGWNTLTKLLVTSPSQSCPSARWVVIMPAPYLRQTMTVCHLLVTSHFTGCEIWASMAARPSTFAA